MIKAHVVKKKLSKLVKHLNIGLKERFFSMLVQKKISGAKFDSKSHKAAKIP